MKQSTIIAHFGENRLEHKGAVVPPIYQNSLFTFESSNAIEKAFDNFNDSYIYTRGNNPTVRLLEEKLAALEKGERAKFFASGMAAISAAIMHFVSSGDHIICIDSVYGPVSNFISEYLGKKFNIEVTYIKGDTLKSYEESLRENTKLIYLESPSSGIFSCQDLKSVAEFAKQHNISTIIDNTWATPIFQNPLTYGIDIVVHSASKYLCGHSDVVAGVIVSSNEIINEIFNYEHNFIGGKIAPFEAWLVLRGLRTLPIRMKKHMESTKIIIEFLENHPLVKEILYPNNNPIAIKQMSGFSGLFSVVLNTDEKGVRLFIDTLKLFSIGVSWGGYESLVYAPIISLSKEMSKEKLEASGIRPGLVRLSIGLEEAEDLIEDIVNALNEVDCN